MEGQIEAQAAAHDDASRQPLTKEQAERERQKDLLLLSRTRVLHELEQTKIPRRREILEASLAYLDSKLAELG